MSVKHNKAGGGNAEVKKELQEVKKETQEVKAAGESTAALLAQCPSRRKSCRIARRERTRFPMK